MPSDIEGLTPEQLDQAESWLDESVNDRGYMGEIALRIE